MNGLAAQRCLRHHEREAAARCPECREFYCRECISEHEGRVLCASCLARPHAAGPPSPPTFRWIRIFVRAACTLAAFLFVWAALYLAGRALLLMPSAFHDGTLWLEWRSTDE